MIRSDILYDVQSTLQRISKYHKNISSGKKVIYPSDDAVIATRASNIGSRIREIQQYKRNIDHVSNVMGSYDSISQEISAIYQRMRELLVRAANGTNSRDERNAIAEELEEIMNHFAAIGNTQIGGEYIFGGLKTDQPPVQKINGEWRVVLPRDADAQRSLNILGMDFKYGITASDIFKTDTGEDVFQIMRDTINKLRRGEDGVELYISNVALKDVSYLEKKAMSSFARIGAMSKTLELMGKRIEDLDQFMTEYLSKEQDADLTEMVTKLSMQNAVLQAALKSGAMVLNKTLVDFV
jgi:flagellar hook-associated protein 3 FlgL